jgi:hypothetical protein
MRPGPHPATIARKPMKDFVFSSQEEPNPTNKYIGRRTGKVYDDKYANGNNIMLQDYYKMKNNILDLYESESETSSESEKSKNSWSSSSEAEESSIEEEEESKDQTIKTNLTKKNISVNNQGNNNIQGNNLNNNLNINDIRNNLLKESDSNDQMLYSMINNRLSVKPESSSSSSSSSPSPPKKSENKIIQKTSTNKNSTNNNINNINSNTISSNINATNNFLKSSTREKDNVKIEVSDHKSIKSSKISHFSFVPHEEQNKFNSRLDEENFISEDDNFDLTILSKKVSIILDKNYLF